MKIRILSDLHIDASYLTLTDKEPFTIISGDTSTSIPKVSNWIKSNVKQGLFIEGNHYAGCKEMPLQLAYQELQRQFPINDSVSFLQNQYKIIENKVFIGCTLWTDLNFEVSNPFNYGHNVQDFYEGTYLEDTNIVPFTIYHSLLEYKKSIEFIQNTINNFPDKDIIIITHHCPSVLCSNNSYKNNIISPVFISNLENFIVNNKNIKAWICGHCHREPLIYKLGNCKIIMNTRGFPHNKGYNSFNQNFIIDI